MLGVIFWIILGLIKCAQTLVLYSSVANGSNKEKLIGLLGHVLQEAGVQIAKSTKDADGLVVTTALAELRQENSVTVFGNDTDIFLLLVFHCHQFRRLYFDGVSIHQVWEALSVAERDWFLLAYTYTGCDTVSHLFRKGKVKVLKQVTADKNPANLRSIMDAFRDPNSPLEVIDREGLRFMQYIYGAIDLLLDNLQYNAYQ